MGKIIRYLYTFYCLIAFIVSFFIFIPAYFILFNFWPASKAPHVAHRVSRLWAAFLFFFFFMRLEIKNMHYIDPSQTYVFVANHLSMLDIPLYARSCTNTLRFLAKAELTKLPLMGYVIKNLYISVNRSDKADRVKSIDMMKRTLDENISVFLAPEGTRNKTGKPLLDFRDGAFRLAIESQRPLAILTIKNTHHHLSPKNWLLMTPGTLQAEWSEPVDTSGMNENDLERLKELVRARMMAILTT